MKPGDLVRWYRYKVGLTRRPAQVISAVVVAVKRNRKVAIDATLPDGRVARRFVDAENLTVCR
jgi:hypothetical protein